MRLITIGLAVLSLAGAVHAQIGCTLEKCKDSFGHADDVLGKREVFTFYPEIESRPSHKIHYCIVAFFIDNTVSNIYYYVAKDPPSTDEIYIEDAKYLIRYCRPDVSWSEPSHNTAKSEMTWKGSVDGKVKYTARLKGTYSVEIIDEDTNAGGIFGAKHETMDGHEVTVLPGPGE